VSVDSFGGSRVKRLYRLSEAAEIFFSRDSGITKKSLRNEAQRGRLKITRIANKDFVTEDDIANMVELCACRVKESPQGSGCENARAGKMSGLSSTDRSSMSLDAARMTLEALKKPPKLT
jgi:hypothetical protein